MTPVELLAILRKTYELVADSARWTEHNFAEDDAGKWAPVGSQRAVRFNLGGALIRSAGPSAREAMRALQELLAGAPLSLDSTMLVCARGLTRMDALKLLQWSIWRLDSPA